MNKTNTLLSLLLLLLVTPATAQQASIETCAEGEPTTDKGLPDEDADGVPDAVDNCLLVANPTQRDSSGDGIGNFCDGDLNNDNVVNVVDLSMLRAVFFDEAANPDADLDGDGAVSLSDLAIIRGLFFKAPGPVGPCIRDPDLCSGPMHFEASDHRSTPDSNLFVIRTSDPATIYHGRRLLSGASQCNQAIAGFTFYGTQPWNPNWEFHIAGDIFFHGDSINASVGCNKSASFVAANLGTWCNIDTRATACNFWCPWTSELTRVLTVAAESE